MDTLPEMFRSNVIRLMKSRGMNRAELAKEMGSFPSVISRMLSGKHLPNGKTLSRTAKALSVDVSKLLAKSR